MLATVARLIAVPIGLCAYYVAFFMYEDEEGRWQSRIESLWIAVNDRERLTGSKSLVLFDRIAVVVTAAFNRIFGRKLFSLQLLGASTSYSFAAVFLGMFLIVAVLFRDARMTSPLPGNLSHTMFIVKVGCFVIGFACLLLAALPSMWPSPLSIGLSLLPFSLITAGTVKLIWRHQANADQLALFVCMIVGVLSDVLALALVRYTVRQISKELTMLRVATALVTQLAVIGLLVVIPIQASGPLLVRFGSQLHFKALLWIGVLNLFTGLAASTFFIMLFLVLMHRLMWPLLSRMIYPIAGRRVFRNHTLMAGVGTACLLFAFPLIPPTLKGILEWLGK
jgi:hypothetical protein